MRLFIIEDEKEICDTVAKSLYDAGANDYMEKPFHLQELEERVRSLTRRKFVQKDVCLESGDIRVHMSSLRKKLKIVLGYDPIRNKVGEGYQIREESGR